MTAIWQFLFWISVALIAYVYFGYPALLWLLSEMQRNRPASPPKDDFKPRVSLIIAAHDEEQIIAQKLENSLTLDYPRDKLEIIVASNGSTDRTDEIVRSYQSQGVILHSIPEPGKTQAQNVTVPLASGEIIVFTDADAVYEPQTLRMLIRNFADARVGLVHGDSIALLGEGWAVSTGTGQYRGYEAILKRLESCLGACITAYGGIVAIRKELFEPMLPFLMEDFVLPILVIAKGYRSVFDAEALMYEIAPKTTSDEFRYRSRVVAQDALASFVLLPRLLKPFKTLLLFELLSHKVLRWLAPFFLVTIFVATVALSSLPFYRWMLVMQLFFYLLAATGCLLQLGQSRVKLLHIPFYFCLANAGALAGILEMLTGVKKPTWRRVESTR